MHCIPVQGITVKKIISLQFFGFKQDLIWKRMAFICFRKIFKKWIERIKKAPVSQFRNMKIN